MAMLDCGHATTGSHLRFAGYPVPVHVGLALSVTLL